MFARYTTVRGDPDKIDAAIEYVDGAARAAVEATEGNRGFATAVQRERGVVVGLSFWDSRESLDNSESRLATVREQAAQAMGGEASFERFEVPIGFRHTIPGRGAVARVSRFEVDPERVDELVSLAREEVVPRVKGAAGLCSFLQLVNRESGAGMVIAAWENQGAAHAFALTAEQLRARASDRVGVRFGDIEVLTVIRTTAELD